MTATTAPEITVTRFDGAGDGYIFAFVASGIAHWGAIAIIRRLDPWQRRWVPELDGWWVSQDAISLLARRVPAIGDAFSAWQQTPTELPGFESWTFEGLPPRLRYAFTGDIGTGGTNRTNGGYRPAADVPRDVARAYSELGLVPGASAREVATARRALARKNHPDAGGKHAAMVAVNAAADVVLRWLRGRQPAAV